MAAPKLAKKFRDVRKESEQARSDAGLFGFTPNPLSPSPPYLNTPYDADAAGKAGVARLAYAAEASRNTNCGKPGALGRCLTACFE